LLPLYDNVPRGRIPFVTGIIIAATLYFFYLEATMTPTELSALFQQYALVPGQFTTSGGSFKLFLNPAAYLPFLSNIFLHGGWMHVISNMWALFLFGDNVEDRMGHFGFFTFYLLTGILAGGAHYYADPTSFVPTVGASGAVAGIMGAYIGLYPGARIITLVPIFIFPLFLRIPAFIYLGGWFALQFMEGMAALSEPVASGGVAWWAHVGGFVAGFLLCAFFLNPAYSPNRRAYNSRARD
jgi:membrane associated rhomboid family serine protease